MKILVIADIHGYYKELQRILSETPEDTDIIICVGDFIDIFRIPEGFSQIDMADIALQSIISLGRPLASIPGNHEPYEITDLLDSYKINLHNKIKKFKDVFILGFGGAETPFNTTFEPTEGEIEKALAKFNPPHNTVLVVHQPPKNTKQDRVAAGNHVGSQVIRNYIEKHQPMLVLTGHIHEGEGLDSIGKSVIFNPGPAFDGKYGIVEIAGKSVKCDIRKAQYIQNTKGATKTKT